MKASTLSFRAAVLFVLVGMAWGIQMAASGNHAAFPAHAHLNLLGWVSLFLFGVFYHLHPLLDPSPAARLQVGVWIVGTTVLTVGVGMVHSGHSSGDSIAAAGSLIVFAGMLAFAWMVFRRERFAPARAAVSRTP